MLQIDQRLIFFFWFQERGSQFGGVEKKINFFNRIIQLRKQVSMR